MEFQPPYFPPPSVQSAEVFGQHLQPDHYHHYAVSTLLYHHYHYHYYYHYQASLQSSGFSHYSSRIAGESHDTGGGLTHSNNNNHQVRELSPHTSHLTPTLCLCSQSTGTPTFPSPSRESLGRITRPVEGQSLQTRSSAPPRADYHFSPPPPSTK